MSKSSTNLTKSSGYKKVAASDAFVNGQGSAQPQRRSSKAVKSIDSFVGARLREARLAAGITQETLANALGVVCQQVQKYEKGANRLSVSRLPAVAKLLGRDITWFFPVDKGASPPRRDNFAELASIAGGHRLAAAYLAINDAKQRAAIVDLVEALIEKKTHKQAGAKQCHAT